LPFGAARLGVKLDQSTLGPLGGGFSLIPNLFYRKDCTLIKTFDLIGLTEN